MYIENPLDNGNANNMLTLHVYMTTIVRHTYDYLYVGARTSQPPKVKEPFHHLQYSSPKVEEPFHLQFSVCEGGRTPYIQYHGYEGGIILPIFNIRLEGGRTFLYLHHQSSSSEGERTPYLQHSVAKGGITLNIFNTIFRT